MLHTNKDKLPVISVQGTVANASGRERDIVDFNGNPYLLAGKGGICYNVKIGDPAFNWVGDHIEPGVSTILSEDKRYGPANSGYNFHACIGNKAKVVTGDAKGAFGTVIGFHGGLEHVMIDFPDSVLESLNMDDTFLIKTCGQGLELNDYPDIRICNLDPMLLLSLGAHDSQKKIEIPVTKKIPAVLMGSGIGLPTTLSGDCDIMTSDESLISEYDLSTLRLGDIVAIEDYDHRYGRCYKKDAISIGIVVHTDSRISGHGPGVTTIMTSGKPCILPIIDSNANIANVLNIGRKVCQTHASSL